MNITNYVCKFEKKKKKYLKVGQVCIHNLHILITIDLNY